MTLLPKIQNNVENEYVISTDLPDLRSARVHQAFRTNNKSTGPTTVNLSERTTRAQARSRAFRTNDKSTGPTLGCFNSLSLWWTLFPVLVCHYL